MRNKVKKMYAEMNEIELIQSHGDWLMELECRGIIRTRNVLGELGERFAINFYNESPQLPDLLPLKIGTKSIDAVGLDGTRYSIKAITGNTTSVFNGLNDTNSSFPQEQKFEHVIIVKFDRYYDLQEIYELQWNNFLNHRTWNKSKRTWQLTITKKLKKDARLLYKK